MQQFTWLGSLEWNYRFDRDADVDFSLNQEIDLSKRKWSMRTGFVFCAFSREDVHHHVGCLLLFISFIHFHLYCATPLGYQHIGFIIFIYSTYHIIIRSCEERVQKQEKTFVLWCGLPPWWWPQSYFYGYLELMDQRYVFWVRIA